MQVNNRLFEIAYILIQKKKVTAKELANKFEVSTRTIYRDIETLSRANIPIYATKGKEGGIEILDEYVLNKMLLTEEEQNQILFALQGIKKVAGQNEKDILEKLSRLFNKKADDWIRIEFSNWGKDKEKEERFNKIKAAILNKNRIKFEYYNTNEEKSEINKKDDGSFIINVEYPENEWVYGYILSFGEYVKVLSPERVKRTIKDKIEKILKNYL